MKVLVKKVKSPLNRFFANEFEKKKALKIMKNNRSTNRKLNPVHRQEQTLKRPQTIFVSINLDRIVKNAFSVKEKNSTHLE